MNEEITWKKKGSYQFNGYDHNEDLIYTIKNKWALGWWYITNVWEGKEVGQDGDAVSAMHKADADHKTPNA